MDGRRICLESIVWFCKSGRWWGNGKFDAPIAHERDSYAFFKTAEDTKCHHSWRLSEDMDEQLFALVVEVGHVRWFHFSEPSKNTSVHGSLSTTPNQSTK